MPQPPSASGSLLAQVLRELQEVRETLTHAATKEDLAALVRRDLYDVQHAADQARLTAAEQQLATVKDRLHAMELTEAARSGQVQSQFVAAQQTQAADASKVKVSILDGQNRLLLGLVGTLSALSMMLLGQLFSLLSHFIH